MSHTITLMNTVTVVYFESNPHIYAPGTVNTHQSTKSVLIRS